MKYYAVAVMAALARTQTYNNIFTTNCHNDDECGAVDGCSKGWDAVAPTEGLFDTNCWCPYGNAILAYAWNDPNNRSGINLYICPNAQG